jgi:hypothetical protein
MQVWEDETDFTHRDYIIAELKRRKLFPSNEVRAWNKETGAYPDLIDPEFLQKLLAKREFADSLQRTWKPKTDPCSEEITTFEVTPVQRFISNFMSPKTPYMSALLYHGVGVGKTCAAITSAEAYLEVFPKRQVFIVAPKNRAILGKRQLPSLAPSNSIPVLSLCHCSRFRLRRRVVLCRYVLDELPRINVRTRAIHDLEYPNESRANNWMHRSGIHAFIFSHNFSFAAR